MVTSIAWIVIEFRDHILNDSAHSFSDTVKLLPRALVDLSQAVFFSLLIRVRAVWTEQY